MALYPHVRWWLWLLALTVALALLRGSGAAPDLSLWVILAPMLLWIVGAVGIAVYEELRYRRRERWWP